MIQLSIDATACFGIAAIITAIASVVWSLRRHPSNGGSGVIQPAQKAIECEREKID